MPNTVETQKQTALTVEPKPINNTPFRRFPVIASIKILKHFHPREDSILLSSSNCAKYGTMKTNSEASTMQFIK